MKWRGVLICVIFGAACTVAAQGINQETADSKLAAEDWKGAISDYHHLLEQEDGNPQNWFNLGSAFHQMGDYEAAKDAYVKAIENDFPRVPQVHIRLARVYMSLDNETQALGALKVVEDAGRPVGRIISSVSEFEPLSDSEQFQSIVKALTPCTDQVYRHFDFWLGEWDVTSAGSNSPTAQSKISVREDGCAVLEVYQTTGGYRGMSINFYDSSREVWHQTWMANNGSPNYLEGQLNEDGAMVLTDADLEISKLTGTINRVTWTPDEKGGVRQFWETSSDVGETWTVAFDGYYSPKAN